MNVPNESTTTFSSFDLLHDRLEPGVQDAAEGLFVELLPFGDMGDEF